MSRLATWVIKTFGHTWSICEFLKIVAWEFVIAALTYPTIVARLLHKGNYYWHSWYTPTILLGVVVALLLVYVKWREKRE